MKKFITTVSNSVKIIKLIAAFADALSAACTAFTEKWSKHFPDTEEQPESPETK